MPGRIRDLIERRSIVALTYLNSLPRPLTFGLVMLLLLAGVATHGILAAIALGIVALFLVWLLYVGWPQMPRSGRVLRLLATLLVAGFAVNQLLR
ncbi:MAG: hypothetical protein DLM59_08900 [Pseudonocardiales bacterium]|nr:MAG: hypothetical protein DLM59_08900 [Pseudonocardiales bacterium]